MNPGLVVKLRPAGPWRIGTDSGARNRVDVIYHSDSLYSAVASAMARLGSLDEWLDATARNGAPAVSFSSCFPFLDEIGFVVPPRTIWPPTSPALMSARVRWKSARFVPLGVVRAMLAGQALDENQWSLDGASECLVPAGRPGPFRTGVRWSAAVDRLTGAAERHSTACIEFRPGAGLWTIVSFQDEAAHSRWLEPIKAAFRLLADTGFGGERSRGWGRSEPPEFTDGTLPDMILRHGGRAGGRGPGCREQRGTQPLEAPQDLHLNRRRRTGAARVRSSDCRRARYGPCSLGPWPLAAGPGRAACCRAARARSHRLPPSLSRSLPGPWPPAPGLARPPPGPLAALPVHPRAGRFRGLASRQLCRAGPLRAAWTAPPVPASSRRKSKWWLKGRCCCAAAPPRGSAADVAPDGFAHPVFRAGFALSIPLPGAER